jgi:hypothetical protein
MLLGKPVDRSTNNGNNHTERWQTSVETGVSASNLMRSYVHVEQDIAL